MAECGYIVRVDYRPKPGHEGDVGIPHRATVKVGHWNILGRCQRLLVNQTDHIHDITIEGPCPSYAGDCLITAGPAAEQPG